MLRERRAHDSRRTRSSGVGPNMVERLLRRSIAGPDAVEPINPHLHNVPLQIAAERGLPALAVWLWFVVALVRDLWTRVSDGAAPRCSPPPRSRRSSRCSPPALFEYNFGDSEFLMLFLLIVTLPFAAGRPIRRRMTLPPARREPRARSRRRASPASRSSSSATSCSIASSSAA